MPKVLPTVLIQEKNALSSSNSWLVLLDVTFKDSSGNFMTDNVQHIVNNTEEVIFNGLTYAPSNFIVNRINEDSKATINNVTLTISNLAQVFQYYLELYSGAVGSLVTIYIVNTGHLTLSTSDYADLIMDYIVLSATANADHITFTLGAEDPLLLRFPQQRYLSYHCAWQFKSVECAYNGTDTECDRTYSSCFIKINTDTKNNTKRFGGFIGLGGGNVRIV